MKRKRAEQIINYLLEKGCKEVPCKPRKYRQFARSDKDGFYFVGKSGALRAGKVAGKSVSLTRLIKKKLD